MVQDKRDFREETLLNASEEALLMMLSGRHGLTKSAMLRTCLHIVGDDFIRKDRLKDTGELTEDFRN